MVMISHLETLQQLHIDKMFYDSLTYYLIFVDLYSLVPSSDLRPLTSLIVRLVPDLRSIFFDCSMNSSFTTTQRNGRSYEIYRKGRKGCEWK